jgi:hypothetical protein
MSAPLAEGTASLAHGLRNPAARRLWKRAAPLTKSQRSPIVRHCAKIDRYPRPPTNAVSNIGHGQGQSEATMANINRRQPKRIKNNVGSMLEM